MGLPGERNVGRGACGVFGARHDGKGPIIGRGFARCQCGPGRRQGKRREGEQPAKPREKCQSPQFEAVPLRDGFALGRQGNCVVEGVAGAPQVGPARRDGVR